MGGAGKVQKKNSRKGKLNEKNSCKPINPKKYSCYGLKKIHTRNLITKKNSCGSKIPLPPHNFSNGPSLNACSVRHAVLFPLFSIFIWMGENNSNTLQVYVWMHIFFGNRVKKFPLSKIIIWIGVAGHLETQINTFSPVRL